MWEPWGAYSQVCLCEKKRKKEKKWLYFSFYFRFLSLEMNLIPPNKPHSAAAAAAKSLQLCPTLCDPIDSSPPGSPVPGILQARTLEWVAISFSNARKWKVKVKSLSHAPLLATPWTAAYQAPPFMGFSRQEYWSGVPLHSPNHILFSINLIICILSIISGEGNGNPLQYSCLENSMTEEPGRL